MDNFSENQKQALKKREEALNEKIDAMAKELDALKDIKKQNEKDIQRLMQENENDGWGKKAKNKLQDLNSSIIKEIRGDSQQNFYQFMFLFFVIERFFLATTFF